MQSNLEAHSAAAMFPMMSADELQALAADIEAHGLVEPVVLFEGKILDGRNRVKACELAGVRVDTVARPHCGLENSLLSQEKLVFSCRLFN